MVNFNVFHPRSWWPGEFFFKLVVHVCRLQLKSICLASLNFLSFLWIYGVPRICFLESWQWCKVRDGRLRLDMVRRRNRVFLSCWCLLRYYRLTFYLSELVQSGDRQDFMCQAFVRTYRELKNRILNWCLCLLLV